jgi:hypothetical protein
MWLLNTHIVDIKICVSYFEYFLVRWLFNEIKVNIICNCCVITVGWLRLQHCIYSKCHQDKCGVQSQNNMQCVAEIVKHFKILYVSSLWYYCIQVFELKQWPSKLVNMEQWGVRESVHAVELFVQVGSVTDTQRRFRHELNQLEAPSPSAARW